MDKPLIDIVWVLICAGLVFMMQAGFLCLETGLTRSKNAINVAIKNVTDFCISVFLFWFFGFALMFGTSYQGIVGTNHFFVGVGHGNSWLSTFFIFQAMFCATATTIVSGAVAERMRYSAYIIVTIVISGIIYPLFGHWAWGGIYQGAPGWLKLKGFIDFAGSSVVHSVGGWVALSALLVIGPRIGRFPKEMESKRIPGSNLPMALLGVLLLFFGWMGFNGGSTLSMNHQVPGIIANTVLAGVSGAILTLAVGWRIRGLPDISLPMMGGLAGLVAITANCHAVDAVSAVLIGSIGGVIAFCIDILLEKYEIDDVISAVSVHAGAGVWGTIAVALFGNLETLNTGLSRFEQFQVQCLGVFICFLLAFGLSYLFFTIINKIFPLRVTPEQEQMGLNFSEHNATTEWLDLVNAMDHQAKTQDLQFKVPEEPNTEVGMVAKQYNNVIGSLFEKEIELQSTVDKLLNTQKDLILSQKQTLQSEKLASLGQLSAGISHEIKNPLAIIELSAEELEDDTDIKSKKSHQHIQKIITASKRANNIIAELLRFSRESDVDYKILDLHQTIDGVLELTKNRAGDKEVELNCEYCKEDVLIKADNILFGQVLLNIIMNAIDAVDKGGKVSVRTYVKNHSEDMIPYVFIEIADNGEGISQANMVSIFNPFFTTKDQGEGTGLGLSTAFNIIKDHKGDISVDSQEGVGSTFTIKIPYNIDNE